MWDLPMRNDITGVCPPKYVLSIYIPHCRECGGYKRKTTAVIL
jgi:hypothetical protein